MSEEEIKKIAKEEFMNNVMEQLDSTLIFTYIQKLENQLQQKENIIKEVREILKYHLSNPSGTKNGWHIDIWSSEDINKLNELLEILDKEKV